MGIFARLLAGAALLCLLSLPGCARFKRAAATSEAVVQHSTAALEDGADRVGDKLGSTMDKAAAKLERVGDKIDQGAKKLGEKLEN